MNKEEFVKLLATYKQCLDNVSSLYDVGVDLMESKYALPLESLMTTMCDAVYTAEGVDWIDWYMYETDFQSRKMEAWDDEQLICQTVEDLYDYIEKYKK